jgi:acylphosphatase
MSGAVTRKIRVSGHVQGVGFRASLRHEALRAGVTGWVRNRADGTVEALLHGAPEAVDSLIAWARRGPPGARVSELLDAAAESGETPPAGFELRASA